MNKIAKYKTVSKRTEGLYKEKGSKFIGIAQACYSEEEVKKLLALWGNEHHQAGHLCYAYRLGVDKAKYRANDDGEPSNSAGAPILGQIESFDLSNVLIGVVRYYGGTKLGVGGLINAYRTAAKDALQNGSIIELEVFNWMDLQFNYEDMPHVLNFLKKNDLEIINKVFEAECSLRTKITLELSEYVKSELKGFKSLEITDLGVY